MTPSLAPCSNGDSGCRSLRQKFLNLFENGQTGRFLLEMLDIGEFLRVRVKHDNSPQSQLAAGLCGGHQHGQRRHHHLPVWEVAGYQENVFSSR
ncbi:unnamed protein product [Coregonus sp. 'balchen']|nr:unnamed protein product [Coregonus sp. 'balchen']